MALHLRSAPMLKDFLLLLRVKMWPVFGSPLSGAACIFRSIRRLFANGSPFMGWLDKHPDRRFGILLNYGEPAWPKDANRGASFANLQKHSDRFMGYVAGESISYDSVDQPALDARIRAAGSRGNPGSTAGSPHRRHRSKSFPTMTARR